MDIRARLGVEINLISDLLEDLSGSSSESEDSCSDSVSSNDSRSEQNNLNDPTEFRGDRNEDFKDDTSSASDSSNASEDDEDNGDADFELDKLDLRLDRLVWAACEKFDARLNSVIATLPQQELHSENKSLIESCLASFYSNLQDQASSCLYTFYGPKSYELSRRLRLAINGKERKAQRYFNKLWTRCLDLGHPDAPVTILTQEAQDIDLRRLVVLRFQQQQERVREASLEQQSTGPSRSSVAGAGESDVKRVWNHITISRDQTRASDFAKELLKILSASSRNQAAEDSNTNHHQTHPIDRLLAQLGAGQLFGPTGRLPSTRDSEEIKAIATSIDHEPALVSPHSAEDTELDKHALLRRTLATKMDSQHETQIAEHLMKPHTGASGSKFDHNLPSRSSSDPQTAADGSLDQLMGRLASLETENRCLKQATETPARAETIYFIQNERRATVPYLAFLDEPSWAVGPGGETVLKSYFGIHDISGYLRQNNDIAFVINKYYDLSYQEHEVRAAIRDKRPLPRAQCSRETVRLQSFEMVQAAEDFVRQRPNFAQEFPGLNIFNGLAAPYLFWYYYRTKNVLEGLSPTSLTSMKLLTSWIEETYGELYDKVEDQLKRGMTSIKTLDFLIKPGDVVAWRDKRDLTAAIAESWPLVGKIPQTREGFPFDFRRDEWGANNKDNETVPLWKSVLKCWQYGFDGSFYRRARDLEIAFEARDQEEEVPIRSLNAYPLQYAPEAWKKTLGARGRIFWSCRHQRIASYEDDRGLYGNSERFMIDFHTYEQLHSDSNSFKKSYPTIDDPKVKRMDPGIMASGRGPPIPDLFVFPNTIPAYNLRSKKWVDLEVDKIRKVTWNKQSFEHLVVDIETKDLIRALITEQIARGQGTDTIDGKGNGLIILLHGGPGTGKTFTAESVAEMAEKPLFRVTCGDIGTRPEEVEKYLESVLHLGKNWGCVVLLDEADVFLEQRTLTDLERNALVSVFLRVLEYYEGILILTSNRVGTFDEAFKSRIQLSLHYENLTEGQRRRVWKNFLGRLKDLERQNASGAAGGERSIPEGKSHSMGIDFDDVECYLSDLAKVEMNGRQIRNAITTARQLAKFKRELMTYHHLQHVIKVSSKFDIYLKNVQEGYSDDQIARGGGIR